MESSRRNWQARLLPSLTNHIALSLMDPTKSKLFWDWIKSVIDVPSTNTRLGWAAETTGSILQRLLDSFGSSAEFNAIQYVWNCLTYTHWPLQTIIDLHWSSLTLSDPHWPLTSLNRTDHHSPSLAITDPHWPSLTLSDLHLSGTQTRVLTRCWTERDISKNRL